MKDFILTHKFVCLLLLITLVLEISIFSVCFGMEESEKLDFSLGIVNTEHLNLRSGPRNNISFHKNIIKRPISKNFWKNWRLVHCTR